MNLNQTSQNHLKAGSVLNRLNPLSWKHASRLDERGQVVVEYILLLVISVTLALLITRVMVGRDPGNPGFVISAWNAMVLEIGDDKADDIRR